MPGFSSILSGAACLSALGCIIFAVLMVKQKAILEADNVAAGRSIRTVEQEKEEALARTGQAEREFSELQVLLREEKNRVSNLQQQSDRARREVLRLEQMHDESEQRIDGVERENRKLKRDLITARTESGSAFGAQSKVDYEAEIRLLRSTIAEMRSPLNQSSLPVVDPSYTAPLPLAPPGSRYEGTVLSLSDDGSVVALSVGSAHGMAEKTRLHLTPSQGTATTVVISTVRPQFCIANVVSGGNKLHRLKKSETIVIIVQ